VIADVNLFQKVSKTLGINLIAPEFGKPGWRKPLMDVSEIFHIQHGDVGVRFPSLICDGGSHGERLLGAP
jgi:hypothetical protein